MKEYASSVRNGISVYLYGNVFGIYLDVVSVVLGIGMASATVLELVDAGNLRIRKDYILSSIRIKAAFWGGLGSVVLLPVHRPIPLCAKKADLRLLCQGRGPVGAPNRLKGATPYYYSSHFLIFANLAKICRGRSGRVSLRKKLYDEPIYIYAGEFTGAGRKSEPVQLYPCHFQDAEGQGPYQPEYQQGGGCHEGPVGVYGHGGDGGIGLRSGV